MSTLVKTVTELTVQTCAHTVKNKGQAIPDVDRMICADGVVLEYRVVHGVCGSRRRLRSFHASQALHQADCALVFSVLLLLKRN